MGPKITLWHWKFGNRDHDDYDSREQEALDLLHGCEASKDREEDHGGGGDEDDVGGVHVQSVPQQLLQEGLVIHCPDAQC